MGLIQLNEVTYIGGPLDGAREQPARMPKETPPMYLDTKSGRYKHEWKCVGAEYDYAFYQPIEGDVVVNRFRYVYAGCRRK